ncbi:MAG: PA2169 family four-helix-bundle protein [Cyclobacteriaceae bacterium]
MTKNSEIISQLNDLLAFNIDAKKGYHRAAEEIDNPSLKGMFMCLAEQRENFRKSIREEVRYLGGEPAAGPHDPDYIQESFAQPDLLLILNTVEQTLEDCLKKEKSNLKFFEKQLMQAEESTRNLIRGQLESVKLSLSDLKMLRADAGLTM